MLEELDRWTQTAHFAQLEPEGDWRTWLFLGGRGAGKTRAGAQATLFRALPGTRIALVGPTLHDVREVMIDGPSGLRTIAPDGMRPVWQATRRRLAWDNGAEAYAFSAEDPESLRRAAIGLGVVVITKRGSSPSRSPKRSMASVSAGLGQAQNSSAQAKWNCGPRRLSGSSAEKA